MSLSRYRNTIARSEEPREAEIRAFAHVNALLAGAAGRAARVAALHTNHKLWSVLLVDLASSGNGLPRELRGQLASLAIWAQRESMRLMDTDGPLDALLSVNRDMAEGLAAQRAGVAASPPAEARPFAPAVA